MGTTSQTQTNTRQLSVAICGNPNCGKTTVFNAITGLRQKVGNYPGVTVEKIFGKFRLPTHPATEFILYDIPGCYSLSAFSPDEYIAAQALFGQPDGSERPDLIVCLIDATNLDRGLYLLFQAIQIGQPIIVGLNMIDLVEKTGTTIDCDRLSERLGGIPVLPLVGSKAKGIDQLLAEIGRAVDREDHPLPSVNDPAVDEVIAGLIAETSGNRTKAEFMRVLFDADGPAEKEFRKSASPEALKQLGQSRKRMQEKFGSLIYAETLEYTSRAKKLSDEVVSKIVSPEDGMSGKLDKALLHPILGPLILIAIMTLMFQSIFTWAAPVMEFVDLTFGALAGLVDSSMAEGPLRSLITDGIIGGVGSVLIFLPQIMILFVFIALLEDSGYMTRAAFLVDRAFSWCGLSGKSFIPMLSSFACAVPGIMATRTIEDKKLRLITIMVAPLMSCSARLPIYTIMITAFVPPVSYLGLFNSQGMVLTLLYLLGIIMAVAVSFLLKKTAYQTEPGTFIMEMPSYKLPNLWSVFIRVYNRSRVFVLRAGTVIMAITIIIWALGYYPHSEEISAEYDQKRQELAASFDQSATASTYTEEQQAELSALGSQEAGAQLRNSYFARMGQAVEPAFRPLGWDWKITMSVLASFPAREVIIATLGTIFNLGSDITGESTSLIDKMRQATWDSGEKIGQPLFTPAVAISIMIFFALSCQCGATLVTIKQEAGRWKYSVFVFAYMSTLGYLGGLVAYQLLSRMGL